MPSGRVRAAGLTANPVAVAAGGRVFRSSSRVRLGDVAPDGHARLDAVVRWLQDVARDDSREVGHADGAGETWVVRSTELWIQRMPSFDEEIELATFCGGVGARWAERRTSIRTPGGGAVEAASLWVCVDRETGRPRRLPDAFHEIWAPAAGGRKVSARRRLPDAPSSPAAEWRAWPMRRADFDMLAHANNAALWAAVDDEATRRLGAAPIGRALVEHLDEAVPGTAIEIGSQTQDGGVEIWLRSGPATHQAVTHQPVTHLAGLVTTR